MWERFPLIPEQASTFASKVDVLYYSLVGFSVFFSLLVFSLIFVFAVRYRRRGEEEHRPGLSHGDLRVEIVWTAIPFLMSVGLLVWAVDLFVAQKRMPEDALEISVVGKQWMWKIQHPTGEREINELHVPVGEPVKLTMTTEDVIHSFYIPAFRLKQDVVPGRFTAMWFEATKVGEYHLFCAEYCGTDHSGMGGTVYVMDPADYERWLAGGETGESPVAVGERLFDSRGCRGCHEEGPRQRGPSLAGVFGSEVELASGETVMADEEYLRESILDPNAKMVAGYRPLMPTFRGQLSDEAVMALIAYIRTLDEGAPGTD